MCHLPIFANNGRRLALQAPGLVLGFLSLLFALLGSPTAFGQQQFQGVCAQVKIIIQQQLTMERIGFDARLEISNNDGTDPLTDFSAALTFENPILSTNGTVNDASSLFFVQAPTFESVNSVTGDGVIAPTTTAVIHWFIIPKITAGGTVPDGVLYQVGCRLAAKLRGADLPPEVMQAMPATIYVKPEPQLQITYFQPRDVQGDDPFTPEVESPVPFTLGVLVKNVGYGIAHSVNINSQQPKIVSAINNLLLVAQLLGSRVNDSPLATANLNVNLGDILPGQTRKGAWDMMTSLSGEFVEFKASYTHASELGGQDTSVIQSLNAYFIAHEVMDDQPGRDSLKDFLADVNTNDTEVIPTAIFESEGDILPVNLLTNAAVVGSAGPGGSFQVNLTADKPGWGYIRLTDPGQAKLRIASVSRSDGKLLNTNNYWTNLRYARGTNAKLTYLNLLDLVDLSSYTYTVTYAPSLVDTNPPVTTMHFVGPAVQTGGKYYITPDSQIYFTAVDESPVNMFYNVTNGAFLPALPFSLPYPGEYPIAFYSVDAASNREANNTNIVVVSSNGALDFANVGALAQPLFTAGDALSVRPVNAPLTFSALGEPVQVDARIDVFQGVVAWATVAGVPSSPTTDTGASLTVAGDAVDYYAYSLNGAAWSAEQPVSTPLTLASLGAGLNTLSVLGRSQHGSYLDASNAVTVSWVVDPAASPTRITGAPATPTRSRTATLNIGGAGVTAYRWTTNNDYYRAEAPAPAVLTLGIGSASAGAMNVAVLGKTNGVFQPTNMPTTVSWQFNPLSGYAQPGLPMVRSLTLPNIGSTPQTFVWDGRNDAGAAISPGWYTIRLTLQDQLGRTNVTTRLVQVGSMSGDAAVLADQTRGPKNPHARGRWVVWQDQSDGNNEIYAQVLVSNLPIVKVTSVALSQENPRTDGRYVVWQGRQVNGNWDIFLKDLSDNSAPQPLTATPSLDEVNPAIDWPWVVWQRRAAGSTTAPWQLFATNLQSRQGFVVWGSTQDQLDPDVQAGRVVWQDWRDVGPGEIYYANLETGDHLRITTNTFGQYHPVIYNNWIVWQDTRNTEVDLYGFDFLRHTEVRLTSTPENETRPFLDGPWLVCLEDSLGSLTANARLIHLPSLRAVPLTRTATLKDRPALANGKAVWLDTANNLSSVQAAEMPSLQAVFQNRNAVVVTEAMASYQHDAYSLLSLWNAQAGVQDITHYTSLVPQVISETVTWSNGAPSGPNFTLQPGTFLWMGFATPQVVDLGTNNVGPVNLAAGVNVLSYAAFPSQYTAFQLLNQLGLANARAVRMLDSASGRWEVAEVASGQPVGSDFVIPRVAVVMLDLASPVNSFKPQ
jgi:beta propeller repeat protein